MSELAKTGYGAEGDDVGGTHDDVEIRYGLDELLGAGITRIDAEVSYQDGTGRRYDASVAADMSSGSNVGPKTRRMTYPSFWPTLVG